MLPAVRLVIYWFVKPKYPIEKPGQRKNPINEQVNDEIVNSPDRTCLSTDIKFSRKPN